MERSREGLQMTVSLRKSLQLAPLVDSMRRWGNGLPVNDLPVSWRVTLRVPATKAMGCGREEYQPRTSLAGGCLVGV